jgi:hypothetical protein
MSVVDRVIAAVIPPETAAARAKARAEARAASEPGSWLATVLDHHVLIEEAFEEVRIAATAGRRTKRRQELASLLTAHCVAEEAVLYPALAHFGEKAHAVTAYTEQSAAKMQLGLLSYLDSTTEDYLDKLGHLRGAVLHHMYAEEGNWFLDLNSEKAKAAQRELTSHYVREFTRYHESTAHIQIPGTRS